MIHTTARSPTAIVVGAGPVGLTAAISLARSGVPTILTGKRPPKIDNRTTALLAGSVAALRTLGVWNSCAGYAAPLRFMRIVDDTGRLWRAPEVKFAADEIGLDAFGHNIENRHLVPALEQSLRGLPDFQFVEDDVIEVAPQVDNIFVKLKSGQTLTGMLAIGADGRHSLCRAAAGISVDEHSYPQVALTVCLKHARPHSDISTEFHTANGPFTLVPLPGNRSSLVWVLDPGAAEEVSKRDDAELAQLIERISHSILGKIEIESGRGSFPLHVAIARRFADNRIVLVGEAGHIIPPIGAQGLNLGLRDAASIAELVVVARRGARDIGALDVLAQYERMRRADVGSRTFAIDILNRSLLSDFLAVQGTRGVGLYLLDRVGPLRRAVMREGIGPVSAQPKLMRGEAL